MLCEEILEYDQQWSHWTQYGGFLAALGEAALICSPEGEIFLANQTWHQLMDARRNAGAAGKRSNIFQLLASVFGDAHGEIEIRLRAGFKALNSQTKFTMDLPHRPQPGEKAGLSAIHAAVLVSGSHRGLLVRLEEFASSMKNTPLPNWLSESLLEELPIFMNVCDQNLRLIWANQTFCREMRATKGELFGKKLTETLRFGSLEPLEQLCSRCLETAHEQSEIINLHIGRRLLILDVTFYPILNTDGEAMYAVGAARDISSRVKSQEAHSAAQNLLNEILEQMPVGFVATDIHLGILRMNAAAARLFGCEPEDRIGAHIKSIIAEPYRLPDTELVQRYFMRGKSISSLGEGAELEGLTSNGVQFPMRLSALKLAFGGFPLYCLMILDMTEIRAAEARLLDAEANMTLMQKQEALGRLAGNIAHDFNNLIAIALGYAENVDMTEDVPVTVHEKMAEIIKAMQRGAGLTGQILAYAKHQNLEVRARDMHELLNEQRSIVQAALSTSVRLILKLESTLRYVQIDEHQFVQVMLNLAVNARDAMPNGGEFTVKTAAVHLDEAFFASRALVPQLGDFIYITATDTGSGMPKEVLSRIFDPYFSTKPRDKGTGLGLSVVYGIVKQHQGYIFCDSVIGVGTRFEIFLPATGVCKEQKTLSEFAPASGLKEEKIQATILLVEDEIPLRRLLECQLREEGFQVYSLSNGREALSFIDSFAGVIDVIVSDIIMPEMSGLEMAEEAALLQPSACIILISGYSRDLLMEPASNRYRRLLIKPFTKDRLINEIYDALKSRPQVEPQTAT